MELLNNLEICLKGIITGVLCAYLLMYGGRPAVPYPLFILDIFDNIWYLYILIIFNYYLAIWDAKIGLFMFISILALLFDYHIFIRKDPDKNNNIKESFINNLSSILYKKIPIIHKLPIIESTYPNNFI